MKHWIFILLLVAGNASAQIRIIVPFPPGGGADALARLMAPKLSELWKEQVIVENKPGASGHIGADFVAKSPADGKTLLMSSTASLTEKNVHQFAPITLVSASPYVIVSSTKANINSVAELISRARANPGKLTFGSSGTGAPPAPAPPPTSPPSCSSPWRRSTCSTSPIRAPAKPPPTSSPARSTSSSPPRKPCSRT
jgi:tripartite-type tricarboxylate transporter receptor subunit TctC